MRRKPRRGRIRPGRWWALVRRADAMPVLFGTRRDAEECAEPGERLVRVLVQATTAAGRAGPGLEDYGR